MLILFRWIVVLGLAFQSVMVFSASPEQKSAIGAGSILEAAERIDLLVEAGLQAQNLDRNELAPDNVFARRVYLDIAGRIPTYVELKQFLNLNSENKRAELIDELLDSEGYVSNFYNYWADILRVKSRGRRTIMVSYQDWIKESLRVNTPYDAFVREMITSEGYVWDDPAVGYYLRDAGMPLDNMSNTAQVFLGTRMQCAQCHDHPFDKWTQKEYYHMASYTFGLQAQLPYGKVPISQDFQRIQRGLAQKAIREGATKQEARKSAQPTAAQRRVVRDLLTPMTAQAAELDRDLRLPDDYQYKNAKPKQKMEPKTPFGGEARIGKNDDQREVYADWMTSSENPRFSTVIANRLWKKAMGVGLIEPVDNFTDDTVASNPDLMNYLTELMIDYDFDMKQYLRTLFNTRTYQSLVPVDTPEPDETYYFQGPILRRMTAEQLWDSLLTLAVIDLDERVGIEPQLRKARAGEQLMEDHVDRLESLDSAALYGMVKKLAELETRFVSFEKIYRQQLQNATTDKERNELRKEYRKVRTQKNQAMELYLAKMNGEDTTEMEQSFGSMNSGGMMAGNAGGKAKDSEAMIEMRRDPRWRGVSPGLVRASEIISPAPPGHFLRQFGQSDREIIENSNDEASVTQALRLLNGETLYWLIKQNSALSRSVQETGNARKRMDVIFSSFFARTPTPRERELMGAQFQEYGNSRGYRQLLTALMNTQEFRFIQ